MNYSTALTLALFGVSSLPAGEHSSYQALYELYEFARHPPTFQAAQLPEWKTASPLPASIRVRTEPRFGLRISLIFVGNRSFPSSALQAAVAHWAGSQPSQVCIRKAVNKFYAVHLRDRATVDRIDYRPARAAIWIDEGDPLTFGETSFVTSEQAIATLWVRSSRPREIL